MIHHTELIQELFEAGKLERKTALAANVAFHDPCYLGRHNHVYDAPRNALVYAGSAVTELARHRTNSFCCGAAAPRCGKKKSMARSGSARIASAKRCRRAWIRWPSVARSA